MTTSSRTPVTSADALRGLIRDIAQNEPDPATITQKILSDLSQEEARVVAEVALHEYVRRTIARPATSLQTASPAARTYETHDGRRTPSRKVAAARDWVAAHLKRSVCVINGDSQTWKHHGECSAFDLRALATEREHKAAQVVAEGAKFERQAEAVEAAGVSTLAELDLATLEAVLR